MFGNDDLEAYLKACRVEMAPQRLSPIPKLTASLLRDDAESELEKRYWALTQRKKQK